jgi:hypothetical protein
MKTKSSSSTLASFRLPLALGLALAAMAGSCSSSSGAKNTDNFVGTWTYQSGTLNGACPGLPAMMNTLTGQTFTLEKGTTSDLLFTLGTCQVKLTVSGTTASADPGQSCMYTLPTFGAVNVMITSWTNETTNGQSMTTNASGTAQVVGNCTVTLNGTATKTATPDASTGG